MNMGGEGKCWGGGVYPQTHMGRKAACADLEGVGVRAVPWKMKIYQIQVVKLLQIWTSPWKKFLDPRMAVITLIMKGHDPCDQSDPLVPCKSRDLHAFLLFIDLSH